VPPDEAGFADGVGEAVDRFRDAEAVVDRVSDAEFDRFADGDADRFADGVADGVAVDRFEDAVAAVRFAAERLPTDVDADAPPPRFARALPATRSR
jgi:hypothetical protein